MQWANTISEDEKCSSRLISNRRPEIIKIERDFLHRCECNRVGQVFGPGRNRILPRHFIDMVEDAAIGRLFGAADEVRRMGGCRRIPRNRRVGRRAIARTGASARRTDTRFHGHASSPRRPVQPGKRMSTAHLPRHPPFGSQQLPGQSRTGCAAYEQVLGPERDTAPPGAAGWPCLSGPAAGSRRRGRAGKGWRRGRWWSVRRRRWRSGRFRAAGRA